MTYYHGIGSMVHIVDAKHESQHLQENKDVFIEKRQYIHSLRRYWSSQASHKCHVGNSVHDLKAKHDSRHLPGTDAYVHRASNDQLMSYLNC